MKIKALTLVMILPFIANSQELKLRDLWYAAPVGTVGGSTTGAFSSSKVEVKTTPVSEVKSKGLSIEQEISYVPVDNLNIAASFGFDSTNYDASSGNNDSDGFTDPTVSAEYRILVSPEHNFYVRPELSFSPSMGDSTDSNELRGNHSFNLLVEVGQVIGAFEYSLGLQSNYQTETKNDTGGNTDAKFDFGILAGAQYDFNEMVSATAGFSLAFLGDSKNPTTGTTTSYDYYFVALLGPQFQFNDKVALAVIGTYGTTTGSSSNPPTTLDIDANTVGVQANLLYNFN